MGRDEEERCRGKKLVEVTVLLELVWQMQEHGELTPQTFYIRHLCHCNDRCSVNTKLRENGKRKQLCSSESSSARGLRNSQRSGTENAPQFFKVAYLSLIKNQQRLRIDALTSGPLPVSHCSSLSSHILSKHTMNSLSKNWYLEHGTNQMDPCVLCFTVNH